MRTLFALLLFVTAVAPAAATPPGEDDTRVATRLAAQTFLELDRHDDQPEDVESYKVALRGVILAYAEALLTCEIGGTPGDVSGPLRNVARAYVVLMKALDSDAERARLRTHGLALKWFVQVHDQALLDHCIDTEPPPVGEAPPATWSVSPHLVVHLESETTYLVEQLREHWPSYLPGADFWSTTARNGQPLAPKVPGDVFAFAPGLYPTFRWTLTYDLDVEAVALNPWRLGDPWKYPTRPFRYLTEDGRPQYGLNNRDALKGRWAQPTPPTYRYVVDGQPVVTTNPDEHPAAEALEPAFPAWFKWGHDPQTWFVGEALDDDGLPTAWFVGGRSYLEHVGAASFARLGFKGPTGNGSAAIVQTENPVAHDASGQRIADGTNWPENPLAVGHEWQTWRDVEFFDCVIDGEAQLDGSGPRSKWGFLSYELGPSARGDEEAGFKWIRGGIWGIRGEHAFYFHNVRGNSPDAFAVWIADAVFHTCWRTAIQVHNRTSEGPSGWGTILFERNRIWDVCLEQGGGGSAITGGGNHDGHWIVRDNDVRLGANPDLPELDSVTGCLVFYAGGGSEGRPTREVTVEGNHFQIGPVSTGRGSARRPCCSFSDIGTLRLVGNTILTAATDARGKEARECLDFDPSSIDQLHLQADQDVFGKVRWGAKVFADVDADGDGWYDGNGWDSLVRELRDGEDADGDGEVVSAGATVITWE